jgi:glycine betaine/choline ABC-type transport system substrate-binding protein
VSARGTAVAAFYDSVVPPDASDSGSQEARVDPPAVGRAMHSMTAVPLRGWMAFVSSLAIVVGVTACGGGGESSRASGTQSNLIKSSPANGKTTITVGSKNFSEEFILGQIYAQAFKAAGYKVSTRLNLGSEKVALNALKKGEISGYPEYTSTALGSFFHVPANEIPSNASGAYREAKTDLAKQGLVAYPPTPFADANAVGTLTTTARKLGLRDVSDLTGKSQSLVLAGSPECPARNDCLAGLERNYGLRFKQFKPVPIRRRYAVLDAGGAQLSILFTSDAQLASSTRYTILTDDKHLIPAGNVIFIASRKVVAQAGPDFAATIKAIQGNLTIPVIQELNSRVDIGKQAPAAVAHEYLKSLGYVQ